MKVRSNSESLDRYVRNSMRAFLDGEQNLKWISGIVDHSGAGRVRALQLFQQLAAFGSPERRAMLSQVLADPVRDLGRVERN